MVNAGAAPPVPLALGILLPPNAPTLTTFFALGRTSVAVRLLSPWWTDLPQLLLPLAVGYQCYRDASNSPMCRNPSSSPNSSTSINNGPPTATYIPPTSTPVVPSTTSTRRPSTVLLPSTTSTPTPSSGGDGATGSGAASSAISVAASALLTWFTGVGVFAFLF